MTLRTRQPVESITVRSPSGQTTEVPRGASNSFIFGQTDLSGVYEVSEEDRNQIDQRFAVNLFDANESDIRPRENVETEYEEIAGRRGWETKRREGWKYLLLAALAVLMIEWYIYNQRVYI